MYHDIFMANVQRLLAEKQLTKQSLAQKAGMSVSFLSDLTNGKANPSLKIMAAIASALDTPLPDLLRSADTAPTAAEPPGQYRVVRRLPQGLSQVAAVLTDYQAFHVRQWDAANRKTMGKSEDSSA